jgi:hypothetical protein
MARVHRAEDAEPVDAAEGVERRPLVAPERGSELALDALRLEARASLDVTDAIRDTLLFVRVGSGSLDGEPLGGPSSALVPTGGTATLTAGPDGLECVRATLGAATDLHAPMGATEPVVALDDVAAGAATGSRSSGSSAAKAGCISATTPRRSAPAQPSGSTRARCTSSRTHTRARSSRCWASSRPRAARPRPT